MSDVAEGSWTPANETEAAMWQALRRGDARQYLEIVVEARLYLPAFDEAGPQRLVTFRAGDETYLPVFTSGEALARQLAGVAAYRTTTYQELLEKRPDPAWRLAIDPGLPIGALLPLDALAAALSGEAPVSPVEPVDPTANNELEQALLDALAAEDMDTLAQVLILAEVHLATARPVSGPPRLDAGFPWRHTPAQPPTVAVFTAAERAPAGSHHVVVPLLDVALAWPDPAWRLAVNPGWPMEFTLAGELVQGLVTRAAALVAEAGTPPQPRPELLVKVLPADQVEWYLQGNWHQITGRVFRDATVRAAQTPAALHAALGGYLPFRADDPAVHLIRWSGHCPALYRTVPDGSLRARAVILPHGARLYRVDAQGEQTWLASFDADAVRWVPAPDGAPQEATDA